jgi:hypothetical protein
MLFSVGGFFSLRLFQGNRLILKHYRFLSFSVMILDFSVMILDFSVMILKCAKKLVCLRNDNCYVVIVKL